MKSIKFYGHSDDTFGYDWMPIGKGDDHDDCARMLIRSYLVESPTTGRLLVAGSYGKMPDATWMIGIAPFAEGDEAPGWIDSIRYEFDGYTPILTLKVPDDTVVTLASVDGKPPSNDV